MAMTLLLCLLAVSLSQSFEERLEYWAFIDEFIDAINHVRMDPSIIRPTVEDVINLRAYKEVIDDSGTERDYFCWDNKEDLLGRKDRGYSGCERKGMLHSGIGSVDSILDTLDAAFGTPPSTLEPFEFSLELSLASAMYLADMEGCSAHPDTIANDGDMHYYIDQIAEYDDHWRFNVVEERLHYSDLEDLMVDILFDDA